MKLILHVGHGKCGSSTIQAFLKHNLNSFYEQGIGVVNQHMKISEPNDLEWWQPATYFHKMIFGNQDTSYLKSDLEKLKHEAEQKKINTIILTNERLCNPKCLTGELNVLEIIGEVFSQVEVVYYIRRQDEYLLSAWQQWGIKLGQSFEVYVEHAITVLKPNFKQCIDGFSKVFGADSLRLGFINKEVLLNGDLITDFINKIGLDINKFTSIKDTNLGIQSGYSDILRRTPTLFESQFDNALKTVLEKNIRYSADILYSKAKPTNFYKLSKKIMDVFESDNKYIYENYFQQFSFDLLFDSNKYEVKSEYDGLRLDNEELRNVLAIQNDLIFSLISKTERLEKEIKKVVNASLLGKLKSKLRKILKR